MMATQVAERPAGEIPEHIQDAMVVLAGAGQGRAIGSVDMEDGRTLLVEVVVNDVTGWQDER